jgi:hypothetical protein
VSSRSKVGGAIAVFVAFTALAVWLWDVRTAAPLSADASGTTSPSSEVVAATGVTSSGAQGQRQAIATNGPTEPERKPCVLLVDVLEFSGEPVAGVDVCLLPPGELHYHVPEKSESMSIQSTGASGRAVFEGLDSGRRHQLGIVPADGNVVWFDARPTRVRSENGAVVVNKGIDKAWLSATDVSGLIPVSLEDETVTRVWVGPGATLRGAVNLAECDSCSIQLTRISHGVRTTRQQIVREAAGEFEFVGVPPGDGYRVNVVCRHREKIFVHEWRKIDIRPGINTLPYRANWQGEAYTIENPAADIMQAGEQLDLYVGGGLPRKRFRFLVDGMRRYQVFGLDTLELLDAQVIGDGRRLEAKVDVRLAMYGSPAVVRISPR